jgi:hypothetical protein
MAANYGAVVTSEEAAALRRKGSKASSSNAMTYARQAVRPQSTLNALSRSVV